jgi:hypothetical protein
MVFGFAINRPTGGSTFGVVNADSEQAAQQRVASETDVAADTVAIIDAAEALSQHGGVALLVPAEM